MKKLLAVLLATFTLFSFVACGGGNDNNDGNQTANKYSVYMPDGAPALAMAKLIKENMQFGEEVTYNVVAATSIGQTVVSKTADVAILPITAASKTIGNAQNYVMLGVVTHGNLYVMSAEEVTSINDLKGKTVGVIGQGQVPDLTFRAILSDAGVGYELVDNEQAPSAEKVGIRYFGAASDMLPLMKQGKLLTGLLPEPAATKITTMNANVSMKIDVQQVYGGDYPQAVLVVKKSIAEENKDFVKALIDAVTENATWVKDNASSAVSAINAVVAEGVTPSLDASAITKTVVENCNIYLQLSKDAKTSVNEYLAKVKAISENSANVLSDDFFYTVD